MRFLHTADLHIEGLPAIGKIMDNGLRERENDVFVALRQISNICIEQSVNGLIIAGDVFETVNPKSTARREWSKWLSSLQTIESLRWIFVIDGNHDKPVSSIRASALETDSTYIESTGFTRLPNGIVSLRHHKPVYLFAHEPRVFIVDDDEDTLENMGCVMCIPHTSDIAAMREWILKTYESNENYAEWFMLVGHMQISEAVTGADEIRLKDGISINDEIFQHPQLRYVALGHIHTPQIIRIQPNNIPLVYSGSLISKDFNDVNNYKKVFVFDIPHDRNIEVPITEIRIEDRNYIVIENGIGLDDLPADVVRYGFVKLTFTGTKDEIRAFDVDGMTQRLLDMGALQVTVNTSIKKHPNDDIDIVDVDDNVQEACYTYIKANAADHLDKEWLIEKTGERLTCN